MRSIVRTEYGGPEVLHLVEAPLPEPAPREVRVRVDAAGLEIGAWHLMAGLPLMVRPALGLPRPRNTGIGSELAGVVDAVGAQVTRFRPGDRVFGIGAGSFAEHTLAQEKHLAPLPEGVTAQSAAASAISAVTALQAMDLRPRAQRVLVLGASGGVGSFALQLAKAQGAHVAAAASAGKLDFVRSLGADEVIDYTVTDPVDGSQRYDLVLEMGGRRRHADLRRALTHDGRAVVVGGEGGGRVTGGFLRNMAAMGRVKGLISTTTVADLERVGQLLASGVLVAAIDRTYPLAETADAMRALLAREVRGKLVIDPTR